MTTLEARKRLFVLVAKFVPGPELVDASQLVNDLEEAAFLEGQQANEIAWRTGIEAGLIRPSEVAA
jgi:hypothetical protein